MSLPSLSIAYGVEVGSPGGAPFLDHAAPRNRIFAKQPCQLRGKENGSELDVGVGVGTSANVVARRLQVGVVAMGGTSKTLEEDQLELIGVQDPQVLVDRLENAGEVVPQEWKSQVSRHAERFRQPIADELFDDAVRHDDRDLIERRAALMQGDTFGQRRD